MIRGFYYVGFAGINSIKYLTPGPHFALRTST